MGGASNSRCRWPPPPLGRRLSAAARWPSLADFGVCGGKSRVFTSALRAPRRHGVPAPGERHGNRKLFILASHLRRETIGSMALAALNQEVASGLVLQGQVRVFLMARVPRLCPMQNRAATCRGANRFSTARRLGADSLAGRAASQGGNRRQHGGNRRQHGARRSLFCAWLLWRRVTARRAASQAFLYKGEVHSPAVRCTERQASDSALSSTPALALTGHQGGRTGLLDSPDEGCR
eukprot:scaffold14521_cov121-Isochrysis_galbana.AAC.5